MFTDSCEFEDFVFSECVFNDCKFSPIIAFENSGFINCKFYNCEWTNIQEYEDRDALDRQAYFSGCIANNDFLDFNHEIVESNTLNQPIEKLILEYFIRDGRKYKDMMNLSKMRSDFIDKKKMFDKAINSMENKKLLALNGGKCFLLKDGVIYYRDKFYNI